MMRKFMAALLAATITAMLVATPAVAQPAGGGGGGEGCTLVGEPVVTHTESGEEGTPELVERTEILAISADKPIFETESSPTITVQDAAGNTYTFVFTG